jgi:hypothetical protein
MDSSLNITNPEALQKAADRCREGIIIPTLAQMKDPSLIPQAIQEKVAKVGLWDFDPLNLFRITWKNDPETGLYNEGNWIEFPSELTGVDARIIGLVGKWFPTGAHKVGAAFGCLVPRLVTGQFDPTTQKAVWPSTGNYCRGGAFDSLLLGCRSVAILPEEMSRERFDWLSNVADEVIATPAANPTSRRSTTSAGSCAAPGPSASSSTSSTSSATHLALQRHRQHHPGDLQKSCRGPASAWEPSSRPRARPAPSPPATSCGSGTRT